MSDHKKSLSFLERAAALTRDAGSLAADLAGHTVEKISGIVSTGSAWTPVGEDTPRNRFLLVRFPAPSVAAYGYTILVAKREDGGGWIFHSSSNIAAPAFSEWAEIPE